MSQITILYIDDEVQVGLSTKKMLESFPDKLFKVVLGSNPDPRKVIEQARDCNPDLILLDLMPPFGGGDVAAELRNTPGFEKVPIALYTISGRETSTEEVEKAGRRAGGLPCIMKGQKAQKLRSELLDVYREKRG